MNRPLHIRDLLKRLNKTFGTMATKELCKYGLTVPQLVVIRQISIEPRTIGQISKAVDLSYSTVSGIIDRLEREQLVERVRDENDRRVVWIRKTEKITELFEKVDLLSGEIYKQHFNSFSEEELNNIINSLEALVTKLEEIES
ncbi:MULTISPECIES: MarR family winged helix-turn-helix transcriptional regulator [Brevibacillus]|jgi:DNA-binding MarR family transcriptional regulator|uniref:DNA-binding transcriptional regulator, MarR family n=1 Tax=Brevibacillus centrosporus TaxID=54910 RepID=A0A1I3L790_9BACL|nr:MULTISPECIES: MarR family transcriptional regulator [Brevibacillus]MEC2130145.1 MarR family transcriptional regulator [Brevibacillus centrosporus]MED1793295.1 MarR family transcriptional regulator [Brevibacillus nitrificans]MED1951030.1 MarR family transcriptional regulator [Brevibacillus centrosporus]MED4907049.1 MarR family transcriptional regulator [Brevibacillus centrosporus]RNB66232.1 MarR family transcriptional regulator [Brevibacillus centrosporus]